MHIMLLSAAIALVSTSTSPITVREEKVSGIRTRVGAWVSKSGGKQ